MRVGAFSFDFAIDSQSDPPIVHPGGCTWYRLIVPYSEVDRHCDDIDWAGAYGELAVCPSGEICAVGFDHELIGGLDVVILQRWMHQDAERIIRRARAIGQVVVQDVDDLLDGAHPANEAWLQTANNPDRAIEKRRRSGKISAAEAERQHKVLAEYRRNGATFDVVNRRGYLRSVAASSAVIASTPYLKGRLERSQQRPTHLLRNSIDLERWRQARGERVDPGLVLGWHGSIGHRSGDWEAVKPCIKPWLEAHSDVPIIQVGWRNGVASICQILGLPAHRQIYVPPTPLAAIPKMITSFGIGLVPLARHPFNEAKSALKSMEMLAAGVAPIASASSEYEWLNAGLVVRNTRRLWEAALEQLSCSSEREATAAAGYKRLQDLDIVVTWNDWAETLRDIVAA